MGNSLLLVIILAQGLPNPSASPKRGNNQQASLESEERGFVSFLQPSYIPSCAGARTIALDIEVEFVL
jgi:hypothetical protein